MTLGTEDTAAWAGQSQADLAELRLPRPPGIARRTLAKYPRAVDLIIVVSYLLGVVLVIAVDLLFAFYLDELSDIDPGAAAQITAREGYLRLPWLLVTGAAVALTALMLYMRRSRPLLGVSVTSALTFVETGLVEFPNAVAVMFLLYAVPVYGSVKRAWVAYVIATFSVLLTLHLTGDSGHGVFGPAGILLAEPAQFTSVNETTISAGIITSLWLLIVLMFGINVGNRQRYVAALIDRVHQLARDREQRAQLATAAERARIAREMHDVVAHSLSVVVTLSEAASVVAATQPTEAAHAMQRAAETGRSALAEMRRLLGVLGEPPSEAVAVSDVQPLAPQPAVAQLPDLIAGFREAGLEVSMTQSGSPPADAAHQLAVFRIVQECLTNALRHAGPGTEVRTVLHYGEAATEIEVTDSGPVLTKRNTVATSIPSGGRGLTGIVQRAEMFDGKATFGPSGAGWRVRVSLPVKPLPDVKASTL